MAVRVDGLAALRRDFGKMDKKLQVELRDELKSVAGIVATEARSNADSIFTHRSGKLRKSIKPGTRGAVAIVQANATNKGYRYPRLHEYGNGGKRAFLRPALESKQGEVVDAMGDVLDSIHEKIGRFRGPD